MFSFCFILHCGPADGSRFAYRIYIKLLSSYHTSHLHNHAINRKPRTSTINLYLIRKPSQATELIFLLKLDMHSKICSKIHCDYRPLYYLYLSKFSIKQTARLYGPKRCKSNQNHLSVTFLWHRIHTFSIMPIISPHKHSMRALSKNCQIMPRFNKLNTVHEAQRWA